MGKDRGTLKERNANMWFGKDIFQGIEDDEELEEADVKEAIENIKKQGGKILTSKQKKAKIQAYNSDDSDEEEQSENEAKDANVVVESSDSSSSDEETEVKESRK